MEFLRWSDMAKATIANQEVVSQDFNSSPLMLSICVIDPLL